MALLNVILLVELFLMATSTRTLFKAMTLWNLYCIVFDLYAALADYQFFAAVFVVLLNCVYVSSVIKVAIKPDSLYRRKLLTKYIKLHYAVRLICDVWTAINIKPIVQETCEGGVWLNPEVVTNISDKFNIYMSEAQVLALSACMLKFNLERMISHFFLPNFYNLVYFGLANKFGSCLQ